MGLILLRVSPAMLLGWRIIAIALIDIFDRRQSCRRDYAFFWEASPRELRGSAEQFPTYESFQATSILRGFRWLRSPYSSFRNEYGTIAHWCGQSLRLDRRLFHFSGVFTRPFGRQNNEPGFRPQLNLRQGL